MRSPVTGRTVWNIKLFFVYSFVIMKFVNLFSLSCALLCFSSNDFVLRIAIYNEYRIQKPIPVAGLSNAFVCVRSLTGIRVVIPPRTLVSVTSECCMVSGVGLRV
jgi:hypothetical protein